MSGADWTPWTYEGSTGVRFKQQDDKLLKQTTQFDSDIILDEIQNQRNHGEKHRAFGGWMVASIPEGPDLINVRKKYPELFHRDSDQELRKAALIRFSNDPDMAKYRVAKA